ncbi:hypothetical protein RRU01S_18_00320 [Agrobacterium rubi TR3 = NBRC 13261]|uniref:Uncharacterized protein n=1 Tax=Agrobacterium rubi TR3 = NBRC 13261 TaxID=1368415 RepID=A0A081CY31_9HYPH|nr:hypothetical protein [Agrobacterium rubi]MBP1881399.1 hypothetical protein [Agrobacterium rubi]MCL6655040.1 hypothetical protein [Agrobacterium rubi]GAK71577.1 hypothetical protein RRU01S_18_00320 [Agrobacterium rubi TR3 = NBRC 13261]
MHTIILARYSEALEWIVDIPVDFRVIIYNKGQEITSPTVLARADEIVARPNVGRESETYLHHMRTRATDDRFFTVFSQGDPITHSPDFIDLLRNWRRWDDVQALSWQWLADRNIPPADNLARYREYFPLHLRVRPETFSLFDWVALEFTDVGAWNMGLVYKTLAGISPNTGNIAAHALRQWKLDALAEEAERHTVGVFSYGAIFAVRNDYVARLSAESRDAMYEFSVGAAAANGYILERMWLHIFGTGFYRRMPFMDQHASALNLPGADDETRIRISHLVLNLVDHGMSMSEVGNFVQDAMRERLTALKAGGDQPAS